VLSDGRLEGRVNLAETVPQDVGEAEEDGSAEAAELEAIDQALQIDPSGWVFRRVDLEVAEVVD
jgi:hypothetical protein